MGIPIFLMVFALWQIRTLAGRRSPRRETLATAGTICIVTGFALKLLMVATTVTGARGNVPLTLTYPILAAGYILLLFGFVGWDRMLLSRPGWTPPLIAMACVALVTWIVSVATTLPWWSVSFVVVIGSVLVIDLLFVGFALRQRLMIALPFLLLHIASVLVSTVIELRPADDTALLNGFLVSATTSAVLFVITTQLITRHTGRGRMLIV
jgi:hypothetical protein